MYAGGSHAYKLLCATMCIYLMGHWQMTPKLVWGMSCESQRTSMWRSNWLLEWHTSKIS